MDRTCGECVVCCEVAEVSGVKAAYTPCPYQSPSPEGSCTLYGQPERPDVCGYFECWWRRGNGIKDWRPDRTGLMLSMNTFGSDGDYGVAIEVRVGAAIGPGRQALVALARRVDRPIIVFASGRHQPEDTGDWVVLRDDLMPRAAAIAGQPLYRLDYNVGMYELLKAAA